MNTSKLAGMNFVLCLLAFLVTSVARVIGINLFSVTFLVLGTVSTACVALIAAGPKWRSSSGRTTLIGCGILGLFGGLVQGLAGVWWSVLLVALLTLLHSLSYPRVVGKKNAQD